MLHSPHLKGLKRLSLGGMDLEDEDAEAMMEELERRFPGQRPQELFIDQDWFVA